MTPGIIISSGFVIKYVLLSLIIMPHSAVGGVIPSPKKTARKSLVSWNLNQLALKEAFAEIQTAQYDVE